MRIKLFEAFNQPYIEIEDDDIESDTIDVTYVPFDNIGWLEKILLDNHKELKCFEIEIDKGYIDLSGKQIPYPIENLQISYVIGVDEFGIYISKGEDGWYWVEYFEWYDSLDSVQRWFKCDQEHGLLECLKDLGTLESSL